MPSGTRLTDGHPTTVSMELYPDIQLWEVEITPPSVTGGGANDLTSLSNDRLRTAAPKSYLELGPVTGRFAYDPSVYGLLAAAQGVNQQVYVFFPDGSAVRFFGWLESFKPNPHKEGEMPTAEITFVPSNEYYDGNEVGPDYTIR